MASRCGLGLLLASCASGPGERPPSALTPPAVTARTLGKHPGPGSAVAFSPDGQAVVSVGTGRPGATLWSVHDGTHRALDSGLTAVAFSPDGDALATVGASARGLPEAVQILDLGRGAVRLLGEHDATVVALAYSPDGRLLASSSADTTVRLWNVQAGTHQVLKHPETVGAVAFYRGGVALAAGVRDGSIRIWKVAGEVVLIQPDCGLAQLWDNVCGGTVLNGHTRPVTSVAFSPDGATLASGSVDGTIRLWNLRDGRYQTLTAGDVVHAISFSRTGNLLAASAGGTMADRRSKILVWDLRTGTHGVLAENPPGNAVRSIAFSPARDILAAIDDDGTVRVWTID